MIAAIAFIGRITGLNGLLATVATYAIIALIAGGGLWGYGAHKYYAGKTAGITQERLAWEKQQALLLRMAEVERKAKQAQIDTIEADYLALQELLNQERAEAALEEAIRKEGADAKPALPRSISRALNGVGR